MLKGKKFNAFALHISCCALVFQLLCMRRTAVVRLFNGNSIDCLC